MNKSLIVFAFVVMTFLGAAGSLWLKFGAVRARNFILIVFNPWFIMGGIVYFISALIDIWLLKYLPYVLVLPLTSLTYCWSMMLAGVFLKEHVTKTKIIGLVLIVIGMSLLVL